jgi:hypothetical protein
LSNKLYFLSLIFVFICDSLLLIGPSQKVLDVFQMETLPISYKIKLGLIIAVNSVCTVSFEWKAVPYIVSQWQQKKKEDAY